MLKYFGILMIAFMSLVTFLPGNGFSLEETKTSLVMDPYHIAAFKNGVSIVRSEVELSSADGSFRIHPLPDASLGSFWLSWDKGINLTNITATQAKTTTTVPASNFPELLEANIGNTVWLQLNGDDVMTAWQNYKIIDIPKPSESDAVYPKRDQILPPPVPNRGSMVVLELLSNTPLKTMYKPSPQRLIIPISDVKRIMFDEESSYEMEQHTIENVIDFDVTKIGNTSPDKPKVWVTYLANGIAWSPSYVIDISDDDKALFSAKSVIMNDLLPLEDVETELIAGFPHLQYSEKNSAFSLTPIQQILEKAGRGRVQEDFTNNTFYAGAQVRMSADMSRPSMPEAAVGGEQTEDLYFYQLDNISLKKGERGYFPMFANTIDYEHLYTWTIPNYIDNNNNYRFDLVEAPQEIWHSIKLKNNSKQPWTSAPAMVMKDNRVLGQDTLLYTAPNAETNLKITQALDIQAEVTENEVNRQPNAIQQQRRSFDLVTVKGTIAITNYKNSAVTLEIKKRLSGEVQNADGDPEITKIAEGLRSVNPTSELVWNVELKPGFENKQVFEYSYTVHVQR